MALSNKLCALAAASTMLASAAMADGYEFRAYSSREDTISRGHGNAPNHNRAVHTVNPWPAAAWNQNIPLNGERARLAAERYQSNTVIPPRGLNTQTINTQSR